VFEVFEGRGLVVIAATQATELAYENKNAAQEAVPSLFTSALVEGIESGAADYNHHGLITVSEAFDYAANRLRASGAPQTPKILSEGTGDFFIAIAPPQPGILPSDVRNAIGSQQPEIRGGAVAALAKIARSRSEDEHTRVAAAHALGILRDDSDDVVMQRARRTTRILLGQLTRDEDAAIKKAVMELIHHAAEHGTDPQSHLGAAAKSSSSQASARDEPLAESFSFDKPRDPQWFKHAVFYEVLVRGFHDSNGDGTGDLRGLISRLDYLQWLGIDCIWLPPIYASPLKDGGYDIADFMALQPELGGIGDFVELVEMAHQRGIRVVTDLVMNHTSDQHPWFQASRSDPDGPFGDFYVWSDTDDRYKDARIIFVDTEQSNWSYDPVRGQYYWHRFFYHQPDLNYENPKVQDAMLEVLRFWLDLGIDGFRLHAVPYLYEREGTNCENLKETHEYLKRVRAEVDLQYPDRVLLAEANQWPADVVEYFGDPAVGGDECHMAFHFPLMPRIFMAVRREQRYPISEILAQTPQIPSGCQWAIFLRNHDELTLEMVTDDERDYMYAEYAKDPRMKAKIGIRRRLAPLLDNDRNQLQLFTALLLSLPGSPVMYYGDEIGMGDNIWLGDRDSVRTPMQWTPDRNGGFSLGDPSRLYLPLIMDPIYGYQALNVEAQERSPASLLHWTRRMIDIRKHHPVLGLGGCEELACSNPSVLAFVRESSEGCLLCVSNLSRYPQTAELDLRRFEDITPVDCFGGNLFPTIHDWPYNVSFQGYGFYWLDLNASNT
jgi:maltose alpha-D-glucosyltransferase/alpha-amylase